MRRQLRLQPTMPMCLQKWTKGQMLCQQAVAELHNCKNLHQRL
ncbi:maker234 [Drosophila busckii]|uniref:Maker234 n=1 Tax=Drosophila busckii TaxID=30019 RepID=A0A0M4EQY7_DROBS|nr:maker234 [Drosophila busckii]